MILMLRTHSFEIERVMFRSNAQPNASAWDRVTADNPSLTRQVSENPQLQRPHSMVNTAGRSPSHMQLKKFAVGADSIILGTNRSGRILDTSGNTKVSFGCPCHLRLKAYSF